MSTLEDWENSVRCLWDEGGGRLVRLPGVDLTEWVYWAAHGPDDVDRLYIDHEIIGC